MNELNRYHLFILAAVLWFPVLYGFGFGSIGLANMLFFTLLIAAFEAWAAPEPMPGTFWAEDEKFFFVWGGIFLIVWFGIYGYSWMGNHTRFDNLIEISAWFIMGGFTIGSLVTAVAFKFRQYLIREGYVEPGEKERNHSDQEEEAENTSDFKSQQREQQYQNQQQYDFASDFDTDFDFDASRFDGSKQQTQGEVELPYGFDLSRFKDAKIAKKYRRRQNIALDPNASRNERQSALKWMIAADNGEIDDIQALSNSA